MREAVGSGRRRARREGLDKYKLGQTTTGDTGGRSARRGEVSWTCDTTTTGVRALRLSTAIELSKCEGVKEARGADTESTQKNQRTSIFGSHQSHRFPRTDPNLKPFPRSNPPLSAVTVHGKLQGVRRGGMLLYRSSTSFQRRVKWTVIGLEERVECAAKRPERKNEREGMSRRVVLRPKFDLVTLGSSCLHFW